MTFTAENKRRTVLMLLNDSEWSQREFVRRVMAEAQARVATEGVEA